MNIQIYFDDILLEYVAMDTDNYCGCPDCQDPLGYGSTRKEAIEDLEDKLNTMPIGD